MDKINPVYKNMVLKVKTDGEAYTDSKMQDVYKQQKAALDDIHNFIGKLYIKYAKNGVLNPTTTQKQAIIAALDVKLKDMAKNLGQAEVNTVTSILSRNYVDSYYKNAYILDSGSKGGGKDGRR